MKNKLAVGMILFVVVFIMIVVIIDLFTFGIIPEVSGVICFGVTAVLGFSILIERLTR